MHFKRKKISIYNPLVIFIAIVLFAVSVSAETTDTTEMKGTQLPVSPEKKSYNMLYGVGRGLVNVITSPAELFRTVSYQISADPIGGIFVGIPLGVGYTVGRMSIGALDVLTIGLIGDHLYSNEVFPEFIWQERWTVDD